MHAISPLVHSEFLDSSRGQLLLPILRFIPKQEEGAKSLETGS